MFKVEPGGSVQKTFDSLFELRFVDIRVQFRPSQLNLCDVTIIIDLIICCKVNSLRTTINIAMHFE